jgi:AhpD family alkylhydroperoxidase
MLLTEKEKELVSLGASIASGCRMCTDAHVKESRRVGASNEEIEQAMRDALSVRRSAQVVMERHGLKALGRKLLGLDEGADAADEAIAEVSPTRMGELVAVAAAFAVNCEANLDAHAAAARDLGATEKQIRAVVGISKFVKGKADSLCCKWI